MSAVAGFFRETLRAPRATSALVHLADAFAVAHGYVASPAARDYATKQGGALLDGEPRALLGQGTVPYELGTCRVAAAGRVPDREAP